MSEHDQPALALKLVPRLKISILALRIGPMVTSILLDIIRCNVHVASREKKKTDKLSVMNL